MLGPQAKSFTILRDPSDAFESGYEFYRVGSVTGLSMEELIEKSVKIIYRFFVIYCTNLIDVN